MKQYQLAMPQQVFSGETGMQALESLAARHKKAAVFTDAGIRASGILERPLAELDKAALPYIINDTLDVYKRQAQDRLCRGGSVRLLRRPRLRPRYRRLPGLFPGAGRPLYGGRGCLLYTSRCV